MQEDRGRFHVRAKLARAVQRNVDQAEIDRLRAEYRTIALSEHIRRVVDDWPPLSAEQKAHLASLLHSSPSTEDEGAVAA